MIEEEYEPDGKLNEVSPKHFLASQLKGRKEGDKFVLSKGSATERLATIKTNIEQIRLPIPGLSHALADQIPFRSRR